MNNERKPFAETVAEKLIEQLREGTAPWQKPWAPGEAGSNMPFNPTTGSRYKGVNALQLMSEGYEDPRWMTYKQASAADAQVRKGESGTPIQYWKFSEEQVLKDIAGKPVLDARGALVTENVTLERPRVFFATVFNAEQIDGLEPLERKAQTWDANERAEEILKASGAAFQNGEHDRAFYRPSTDSIHLPERSSFPSADNYYATALHELGHWTGHESRLARDLAHPFGSDAYAKEELRAEIASMILGDELGVGHDPKQHAAYVESWIKVLRNDPTEIFRAAADAEKIQGYVLGFERQLVKDESLQQGQQYAARAGRASPPSELDSMEVAMGVLNEGIGEISGALRAETWVLDRAEHGLLLRALDLANAPQLKRIQAVLATIEPLRQENPFWQRHVLPSDTRHLGDRIDAAIAFATQRLADVPVIAARLGMLTGGDAGPEAAPDAADFSQVAEDALGFALPLDWSGRVRVEGYGTEMVDGEEVFTTSLRKNVKPEAWGVFAQHVHGGFAMVAASPSEQEAIRLAERLSLIDAHSTVNEHEKAAKLARLHEERVRRDPDSTDEDITAARELRKNSEFIATKNDEDLQRRIAVEESRKAQQNQMAPAAQADKMLIEVPYKQKEEAKALGAKWDRQEQSWFVPPGIDPAPFAKWERAGTQTRTGALQSATTAIRTESNANGAEARQYLAVPYGDRAQAKASGAEWDKNAKSWYAGSKSDMAKLAKWRPENVPAQQGPAMTPREEFTEALASAGCIISGDHPIMDGTKQRITVEGEKFTERSGSGFYVGHLDGHPAGYIKNNKTGEELTWKAKGYTLAPEEKALMAAEAAGKLKRREAELATRQEQASARVTRQTSKLVPMSQPTPYLLSKGVNADHGALTDKEGKKTYLPAVDADGKQWTMQYINEAGTKRFAKESKKEGCFHVVGGLEQLAKAPAIVIAEGYATAATLKQALLMATVCAFDSGNLAPVAQALHRKFPDKPIVIAGDDDRHLEITQGVNPGRTKAEEAAKLVGGKVLLPIFAPRENSYPAGLELVTVKALRDHQKGNDTLSDEQLAALSRMKQFTDFNDLATKSILGQDAVDRQATLLVLEVIKKHHRAQMEQQAPHPDPDDIQIATPAEKHKRRRTAKVG